MFKCAASHGQLNHFRCSATVSVESLRGFTSGLAKVSASRAVRRILVVHMGVKLPG